MESELTQPRTRRESEVWQACDDLWSKTSSVRHLTGDNIRDYLLKLGYKRGSPNEIYRYRNSWKDSRGISDLDGDAENEVKTNDPISRAVSLVYDQIRSQTNDTLSQLKEDYETRLSEVTEALESSNQRVADLEHANHTLKENLTEAAETISSLKIERDELQKRAFVLNEKVKTAQDKQDAISKEHNVLILEMKSFHEREIDIWREKNKELNQILAEAKKEAKDAAERQGAIFSEELMSLKTMLRQANEEKEIAKAKVLAMEDSLKEARLVQQQVASGIQLQLANLTGRIELEGKSQAARLQVLKRDIMAASQRRKTSRDSRKHR